MPIMITSGYDKIGRDAEIVVRLAMRPAFGQQRGFARNSTGERYRLVGSVSSQKIFERAAYSKYQIRVNPFLAFRGVIGIGERTGRNGMRQPCHPDHRQREAD
jgi:hypothetical protein